jgi:hypothetical protein
VKSYEVLRKAVHQAGVKSVAADMKLSSSLVYKWCQESEQPQAAGTDNPLDRLLQICQLTDNTEPVQWLCQQLNGFFVTNPKRPPEEFLPLFSATQKLLSEFTELLTAISQSVENDGVISPSEASSIRLEWEHLKSLAETFVVACEKGVYCEPEKNSQ